MDEDHLTRQPSAFAETTATVREAARGVRHALEHGQAPGQWKVIVSDLVREAPLPSLTVAFLIGVMVARR